MIDPQAYAEGHRYEMSPFGCGCWCYNHPVPTDLCDFDLEDVEYTQEEYDAAIREYSRIVRNEDGTHNEQECPCYGCTGQ